jgi:hypothetical protein
LRTDTSAHTLTESIAARDVAQELVPLAIATRSISATVYRNNGDADRLIAIAHTLAALAPLYTHNADGSEVRRLTDEELLSGVFRRGGAELHFANGRPAITNIAATNRAIQEVAGILASAEEDARL